MITWKFGCEWFERVTTFFSFFFFFIFSLLSFCHFSSVFWRFQLCTTILEMQGDQASIIGGAINFVKELEHLLQTLEAHKRTTPQQQQQQHPPNNNGQSSTSLFADFFAFPQYSTSSKNNCTDTSSPAAADKPRPVAFGDIEVTMVESHASLKVLSKRRPRQLLKLVAGLQCLRLSVLHLSVTSADQMVLYSLSVKVSRG